MNDEPDLSPEQAAELCARIEERIRTAAVVDHEVLSAILAAVVARGHVLIEDVPGTGKSVTARVLARALGLSFGRIQFTPDLLPSDVTGSNVYNEHDRTFEFSEGPVFTNVVLADEINRAPPKTQAALLEAMEERQVSVDGKTHDLPRPFIVAATQNPIEQEGTFPLPEAQRDRFGVEVSLGYPDADGEMELLDMRANRRTLAPTVEPVVDRETVLALQALAEEVTVDEKVRRYIVDLARQTREDARTEVGVSPRGIQRVFEVARGAALVDGRDYVVPDDVKQLAVQTMAHRLVLTTEATVEGVDPADVIETAVGWVDVPAVAPGADEGPDRAAEGSGQPASDQRQGGQQPPGQQPSGKQPHGQQPPSQQPPGQQPSGQQPPGQQPHGQHPLDAEPDRGRRQPRGHHGQPPGQGPNDGRQQRGQSNDPPRDGRQRQGQRPRDGRQNQRDGQQPGGDPPRGDHEASDREDRTHQE